MGFKISSELFSVDMSHPAFHTSLIPQALLAFLTLPSQRLQGIFQPIGFWENKMPLPTPTVTMGLQRKKHGGKFRFMIVTAVASPTELVPRGEKCSLLPFPLRRLWKMVSGNTNSAIYRPSFA